MNTRTFKIDGMHGNGCADRIRTLLNKEPGVRAARVSFTEGSAEIRYNPRSIDEASPDCTWHVADWVRPLRETGG